MSRPLTGTGLAGVSGVPAEDWMEAGPRNANLRPNRDPIGPEEWPRGGRRRVELMDRPGASSVVALAFGRYIVEPFFSPCPAPEVLVKMVSITGVSFVVAVNCWSVNWATRLQILLTAIKMGALVLIIVPGMIRLASGHTENFHKAFDTSSLTLDKLPLAFYSGLYAYAGCICFFRNIPLSIILSMVTVTIAYLLANISYYTVMTSQDVLESNAVAMTFADRALQGFSSVIPILVAVSCLGAIMGGCFTTPSYVLYLGLMVLLMSSQYPTVVFMILAGELFGLLNFYSFSRWLFMGLNTIGLMVHRYRNPDLPRPFKVFHLFSERGINLKVHFSPNIPAMGFPVDSGKPSLVLLLLPTLAIEWWWLALFKAHPEAFQVIDHLVLIELQGGAEDSSCRAADSMQLPLAAIRAPKQAVEDSISRGAMRQAGGSPSTREAATKCSGGSIELPMVAPLEPMQ
ncbi:XCT protein, partial [Polypterus senegalus]